MLNRRTSRRPWLLCAGVLALLSSPALVAQAPTPAGNPPASPSGNAPSPTDLKLANDKLRWETEKLREETGALRDANNALDTRARWLVPWLAAIGSAFVTLLAGIVGFFIQRNQEKRLSQDKEVAREKHLLALFKSLGDPDPTIRIGAVAVLIERIVKIRSLPNQSEYEEDRRELPTLVSVLIAATKHEIQTENQKYIADGLATSLGAIVPKDKDVEAGTESPLKGYNLQEARFENAWWQRLDARGIDFFSAKLRRAGLREAFLSGTVLMRADLTEATLVKAKLDKANLQEASLQRARLNQANLRSANLRKADLREADLDGCDLRGAILDGAKLQGARFGCANLTGVDLTNAETDVRTDLSKVIQ